MRHRERAGRIGLAVLGCIGVASFVAAAAVMPGVAAFARWLPREPDWRRRGSVDRALKRLLRRGLVEEVQRGRIVGYRLTDRGREDLARREFARTEIKQPKRWDGKWRLVIFDVPEARRHLRDDLRVHFTRLGLYPIQKSVWLYPYPCDDLVRLITVDLGLGSNVQYFTVEKFTDREEEKAWRLHFDV